MSEKPFKVIIFLAMLFLVFIPVFTSSLLDVEQKKINEENAAKILQQELALQEAKDKIYLMGKFDPSTREDFAPVPAKYDISGYTMYLRKETLDAFEDMAEAANKDGIELNIASATRNFDYQKNLWDKKWEGATLVDGKNLSKGIPDGLERFKKILEYSAVPETSRHHWGTEIDLNDANPAYFRTEKGQKVYEWLVENAADFGFCETYNVKDANRRSGYNEEKWHWSYLPLSRNFTQEYKKLIKDDDIKGFDGDEYVSNFDLINDYVLSINPDCL